MTSEAPSTSEPSIPVHSDTDMNLTSPSTYIKIPPPPSEHPPPYTPYSGHCLTLLPANSQDPNTQRIDGAQNRSPNVVYPPGWQKYLQYVTIRNVLIAICVLLALALFIHLIRWSNRSDYEMNDTSIMPGTKPLDVAWLSLGEYNQSLERLSYDESADKVILSQYYRDEHLLHCESIDINHHLKGFRDFTHYISKIFAACVCFTERVYCCSTDSNSRHHQTECFFNNKGEVVHSVVVMFDFTRHWQSLADDEQLLLLHNYQRNSLLDLRSKRVFQIEENRLPAKYISVGFFFPMDSAVELEELVRSGDEFRLCKHLRSNTGDYTLKDELCTATPFTVEFELPKVKFCSNPLYTAVIQYGHLAGEPQTLTWHLRVKYDSSPDVFSASESFAAGRDELVIDCNYRELDIFALGKHVLNQYTITLPNLRSEHFIQTRSN